MSPWNWPSEYRPPVLWTKTNFHSPMGCLYRQVGLYTAQVDCVFVVYFNGINEPPHDKTNKMACAPSEDSDQPGHLPRLIRVFAVRMKKTWVLSYPFTVKTLIRLGRCPGWSESSLCALSFCWFCYQAAQMTSIPWKKKTIANSVDPNQMLQKMNVPCNLGLHYLHFLYDLIQTFL